MMHATHLEVVPALVYEPIPEYVPMAMNSKEEDPSKEVDPSEGINNPITNWDIDSGSSFYYSDSFVLSNQGNQTRSRGCEFSRGHGYRF